MELLATSTTIEGIAEQINRYFYSKLYTVSEDLEIKHPAKVLNNHRVSFKNGRYRFEETEAPKYGLKQS